MKKFTLLVSFLAVMSFGFSSNVVPVGDAVKVSKNFLSERIGSMKAQSFDITLAYTEYDQNGTPVYYRFQVGEKGFIMISATDQVTPVLAYSLEGNFVENSAVKYLCDKYKEDLSKIIANPSKSANSLWAYYLSNDFQLRPVKAGEGIEPLVTTKWDQTRYYNTNCPYNPRNVASEDFRVPVGCVALTMGNILYYYRYPSSGQGISSYIPREFDDETGELIYTYPIQVANFAQTFYNYNAMTDIVSSYNNSVAQMLHHCGISVQMGYGFDGSGSQSEYALNALKTHFNYAQAGQFQNITDVVTDTSAEHAASTIPLWEAKLLNELNNHRPIFYSGNNKEAGGHAWIVDGYNKINDVNYYHVNWGWSGSSNGFYLLRKMNTSSYGDFNYHFSESMMVNLYPADTNALIKPTTGTTRVTAANGTISDGAGNMKYQPNTHREWIIACPNATAYVFQFSKLKLKNGDKVTIYNGGTTSSSIKQEYTGEYLMAACSDYSGYASDFQGQTLPGSVRVNADSVLIVFTSNADDQTGYGFVLGYEVPTFSIGTCSQVANFNNVYSGTISDKANNEVNDQPYRANSVCGYKLRGLKTGIGYDVAFPKFDLKAGDFVEFYVDAEYDQGGTGPNLTGGDFYVRYDINNMPSGVINIPSKDVYVRFVSDNWEEGTGFQMNFYGRLGIDHNSGLEDVSIFPNPATDNLFVKMNAEAQDVLATVVDITGQVVYTEMFNHGGGESQYTLPVNSLSNGIYFLNLQSKSGKATYKFIVKK
ncbi:MAG: C10 family peptidase [Bacteroidales bacterium]|nr:C10 family peptidase [Bacteroidales bacterium]